MATVTKTVGASGADYTTMALWEADLDDGTNAAINTTAYGSGDVAVCELIDAAQTVTSLTINGGGTVGLAGIVIRPATGNKHDGTFGSGCTINVGGNLSCITHSVAIPLTIEDIEFYSNVASGNYSFGRFIFCNAATTFTIQRNLFRTDGGDRSSGSTCEAIACSSSGSPTANILNNVFHKITRGSANAGTAIVSGTWAGTLVIANNTFAECYNGVDVTSSGTTATVRNNVSVYNTGADYLNPSNYDTASNNISDDGTHGTTTSQALADLFVNSAAGDFTPKTGSDLIGAGADLGASPTGVNIDLKGRDRDSEGDTWDIGAIQSFTVSSFQAAWALQANQ